MSKGKPNRRKQSKSEKRRAQPAPVVETVAPPRFHWALPFTLLLATFAVYVNSFDGVFLFDDLRTVVNNVRIRDFNNLLADRRPVVNVLMALNYRFGQLEPFGYHLVNVSVHALAGLTLFALVRGTLRLEPLRERWAGVDGWFAFVVALL